MYGGGGGEGGGMILYLECIIDLEEKHVYIWFQYCAHIQTFHAWRQIGCENPPSQARKLACLDIFCESFLARKPIGW